jgi:hypothetical protein
MKTDELIDELSQSLKPVRTIPGPRVRTCIWLAAAVTLSVALISAVRLRFPLLYEQAGPAFFLESLSAFMAALMAAASAIYLSVPGEKPSLLAGGAVLGAAAWLGSICFRWAGDAAPFHVPALNEMHCGRDILMGGFLSAGILIGMLKRAAPVHPVFSGLLGALASAMLAVLALQFFCPVQSPWHLVTCHVVPAFVVTLTGAMAGRWLLTW